MGTSIKQQERRSGAGVNLKMSTRALRIFISYSHRDDQFRAELETHLVLLKRQGIVESWSDRKILPGQSWGDEIDTRLENAHIVLSLISPDFLASDYCYDKEMRRALEKHDAGDLILIPIIIRHSTWKSSPVAKFQALPQDAKPIAVWQDRDEAWVNVISGLSEICKELNVDRFQNSYGFRKDITKSALKIGVFGMTGVGKSTLCNVLIGQAVMRISDIVPITRHVQRFVGAVGSRTVELFDCPGLGESLDLDEEYRRFYHEVLEIIDLALWVIRADVRTLKDDALFIQGPLKPFIFGHKHFYLVMSMVDRIEPYRHWDSENNKPGISQMINIERRIAYLSGALKLPTSLILPISASEGFNIELLQNRIASVIEHNNFA